MVILGSRNVDLFLRVCLAGKTIICRTINFFLRNSIISIRKGEYTESLNYDNIIMVGSVIDRDSRQMNTNGRVQKSVITYILHNWSERSACEQRSNLGRPLFLVN